VQEPQILPGTQTSLPHQESPFSGHFRLVGLTVSILFGGSLAAALLAYINFNPVASKRFTFGSVGLFAILAACFLAWEIQLPADVISWLVLSRVPEIMVGVPIFWLLRRNVERKVAAGIYRPNWHAARIGCLIAASLGFLTAVLSRLAAAA
jgi:hypothetical protein